MIARYLSTLRDTPPWIIKLDSSYVANTCQFCTMLSSLTVDGTKPTSPPRFLLSLCNERISRADSFICEISSYRDQGQLYLMGERSDIRVLRARPRVDVDMLSRWMEICVEEHKDCGEVVQSAVPGLRVIDCGSRKVVPAPQRLRYITLSYVWGKGSSPQTYSEELPPAGSLPQTIEDSIGLTIRLGFRYLWIDRYCIDQQSPRDVLAQCEQMDRIYANSALTLIAAAGTRLDYGLPGLGTRSRCLNVAVSIKKNESLHATREPWELIRESVWIMRGWTFQEGQLSKRRLFFTDAQVFFECGTKSISDAESPLWRDYSPLSTPGPDAAYWKTLTKELPWSIMDCIQKYSGRDLTQPNDILRAFLGVFNAFSNQAIPVQHCWGVPIWDPRQVLRADRTLAAKMTHPMAFCVGLAFGIHIPRRRHGFPSWSWAGWYGEMLWHYMNQGADIQHILKDIKTRMVDHVEVSIELQSGEIIDLATFQQQSKASRTEQHASQFIRVSSWSVPIRVCKEGVRGPVDVPPDPDNIKDIWRARVKQRTEEEIRFDFRMSDQTPIDGEAFIGIYLGCSSSRSPSDLRPILLICRKVGSCYERVGCIDLENTGLDRYDSKGGSVDFSLWGRTMDDLAPTWGTFRLC
jgi:hypothetical protein